VNKISGQAWNPHQYQRKAMKWLLEHACAALWLDPGLGKTSIVMGAFKVLKKKGLVTRMLVLAPLRPCFLVWPAELQKWTDFHGLKMIVLHGPDKEKLLHEEADIYVMNYEGLDWLTGTRKFGEKSRLQQWMAAGSNQVMLTVDEVTKLKSTNSKRFKLLKPWLGKFSRRWTLTGTCAPNGYMDLFGQIYVADEGVSLGRYISHYRRSYFDAGGYGNYTFTLREGADKEIQEKIKPLVLRMDADDYLDLPKVLVNKVYVELPGEARRIYDDLESEMFSVLQDAKVITALGAAAASIKCRQVANGGIYLQPEEDPGVVQRKDTREWRDLHTAKTDAVLELIEGVQGKPVFITYDFAHDLARLRAVLGKDVPVLGGKGSGPSGIKNDKMLEDAWNKNLLPVLLGHPMSVGHGLNLQLSDCQDMIIHSDTWDHELYDQMIRRIRRQGNKFSFMRLHHIIAVDTVDEALYASHGYKGGIQKALMDAFKKRRKIPVSRL
jgi:SNF2 family DNA or RNA helicase